MHIKPRFKGFICTTAHPEGCKAQVRRQVDYVRENLQQQAKTGPKRVLVIGASTGYGLASRIVSAFGYGADTVGVFFEKPAANNRTATAGWYNTAAFEEIATAEGLRAFSLNGDAFSAEMKRQTLDLIKRELGQVDAVIYSLAAPKRTHPHTGEIYSSVLKPIGQAYTSKTVDFHSQLVTDITIQPATEQEINHTVAVMGGEDWQMWMEMLLAENLVAEGCISLAYSYIGSPLTYPVYHEGTVGRAKDHLEATAKMIDQMLQKLQGHAYISVNKALVTQSSSAIPVVPLYMSLLFKVMTEQQLSEGCIEQITRLFNEELYNTEGKIAHLDEAGRIRLDNWEMKADVQAEVMKNWEQVTSDNVTELSLINQYREDFFKLFGFGDESVDYEKEVDPAVPIASIVEETA